MANKVSVTVLSWDRLEYLKQTVDSLHGNLPAGLDYEFIIFDNGSLPETKNYVNSLHEHGWIVGGAPKNLGIGPGMNRLFEMSSGNVIIHVEDDFVCTRGGSWIEESIWLLNYMPSIIQVQLRDRTDPVLRVQPRNIVETVQAGQEQFHIYPSVEGEYVWSNQVHMLLSHKRKLLHPFPEAEKRGSQERRVNDICIAKGWNAVQLVRGAFKHIGIYQRIEMLAKAAGLHPLQFLRRHPELASEGNRIRNRGKSQMRKPLNNEPINLRQLPYCGGARGL